MKKFGLVFMLAVMLLPLGSVLAKLMPPPAATLAEASRSIKIVSYDPKIKAKKLLGEVKKGTSQWQVLKLLSGPNVINVTYPGEQEQWIYTGLWGQKIGQPLEETVIIMSDAGKRIRKLKAKSVDLHIVFRREGKQDYVDRVQLTLVNNKK